MTFSFFSRNAYRLTQLTGWRRLGTAFLIGSSMALSMPPINFFPILFFCLPAAIFLLEGAKNRRQAFAIGWSFAFGYFVCGIYWTAVSMFVDIAAFWWAVPLAIGGLPAFFAIYYGIAATIWHALRLRGLPGVTAFALLWFLAEYARGHCFTGFPWNLLGYSWSGSLPVLQLTSLIGIYGLTLLTSIAASLPAALGRDPRAKSALAFAVFFFIVAAVYGEIRLRTTEVGVQPNVRLRLVQPNLDQAHKWVMGEREKHFQELLDLSAASAEPGDAMPTHIIWPETASTFYLSEDDFHRKQVARVIPAEGAVLTGVVRRQEDQNGKVQFYNSLVAVDGLGRLIAGYDKAHLVPFGEFMPWRRFIPLRTLASTGTDFTAGPGPVSLRVLGLPLFSPLICYEAIFPGAVIDENDRPDFLLNITNDGWYGNTSGPYQHFAIARVRAIEEGLPLVRVDNPGISGVIDPLGRVTTRLGLGKRGFVDSDLPKSIDPPLFARGREILLWTIFGAFLTYIGFAYVSPSKRHKD